MQKLLFELLQVATGQLDCLSKGPSPEEWNDIYQTARQHGLAGVSYIGVEHLFEYGLRVPQDLSLDWMADAEMIRERQELIDKRCQKLMEKLEERKIRSSVMNGLGMRQNGGSDLQQSLQAETIDIFVDCNIDRALKFVSQTGQQDIVCGYSEIPLTVWADTPVYLHYRLMLARNPLTNRKIQKWASRNKDMMFQHDEAVTVPSLLMNAVCMLQDLQQRFFKGEAMLRHFLEYYFVITQLKDLSAVFKNGDSIETALREMGLERFAGGVMWILQEMMALDRQHMLCAPKEHEGRFILHEVMAGHRHLWRLLSHYPMEMIWPAR
jgi:hypothetical protein